jgi:hypothetical protein
VRLGEAAVILGYLSEKRLGRLLRRYDDTLEMTRLECDDDTAAAARANDDGLTV